MSCADIEAAIDGDTLLWSGTSSFPKSRLAASVRHPDPAVVLHPVQTQLIVFVEIDRLLITHVADAGGV